MRRKLSLLALILLVGYGRLLGCEVCGCAATGSMIGIMPQYKNNFVSLGWRYSRFYASENLDGGSDFFHQTDIRLGFRLGKRLHIQAVLPYNLNTHISEVEKNSYRGSGDSWVMGEFKIFQSSDSSKSAFRHYVSAGAGVKTPTGKFDLENQENPMPANFQMGSGSWDYLLHSMYNLRFRSWGITADISGRINTENADQYLFGNQIVGTAYLSYLIQTSSVNIMPFAGVYHERLGRNVYEGIYQYGTGGTGTYAMLGAEAQTKRWGARVSYTPHLSSDYAGGEISGGNRINANLSFLF
ncbi:MAG: hypothetical protein SF052_17385 [Bacteroidia bacterium]|nr:hypothetical protein [Bacteroidia bacterium]